MLSFYFGTVIIYFIIINAIIIIINACDEAKNNYEERLKGKGQKSILRAEFFALCVSTIPLLRLLCVITMFLMAFLDDENYNKIFNSEEK